MFSGMLTITISLSIVVVTSLRSKQFIVPFLMQRSIRNSLAKCFIKDKRLVSEIIEESSSKIDEIIFLMCINYFIFGEGKLIGISDSGTVIVWLNSISSEFAPQPIILIV